MKNYLKKMLLLIALISFINVGVVNAQETEQKGFVGLSVGPAIPMGEFVKEYCKTGIQVNIDFGYRFAKNIGVYAGFFMTDFSVKRNSDYSVGLFGLVVGPLFTTATGPIELDFKPLIGYSQGSIDLGNGTSANSKSTFIYGGAASVRWNCWRKISLSGNVMYIYGKPEKTDLSSLGITVGVNYRLR
jgi:ABC-type glucose/galactose transport system permease subunit